MIRDGHPVEVDARELVVGDLVVLGSGDRISADLRVIEARPASPLAGWAVALLAAPAVLAADALQKSIRRRRSAQSAL